MAIEFNGSKKNRELEALDLLLKGKSDEYKGRVLDVATCNTKSLRLQSSLF